MESPRFSPDELVRPTASRRAIGTLSRDWAALTADLTFSAFGHGSAAANHLPCWWLLLARQNVALPASPEAALVGDVPRASRASTSWASQGNWTAPSFGSARRPPNGKAYGRGFEMLCRLYETQKPFFEKRRVLPAKKEQLA